MSKKTRHLIKDTKTQNKHLKRCSISFVIREYKLQRTTYMYLLEWLKIKKKKKPDNTK